MKNQNYLQPLLFIKATAWVILGISGMFLVSDFTADQSENMWVNSLIKFGLAIAFLYTGISFERNRTIANSLLIIMIIIIDVIFNLQAPIGIFDVLMLLFDVILYWLLFSFLKSRRIKTD